MHNWIDEMIGKCEDTYLGLIGDDSFEIMRLFQVERMKGEVAPSVLDYRTFRHYEYIQMWKLHIW